MIILAPIGWLYGRIMQLRNALYDRGILQACDLGAKTISIGNITLGGTGKTPLVAYIAKLLTENGEKVCVLTRGYGRRNENESVLVSDSDSVLVDAETGGDEPVELAKKLLGKAIVVADADRVSAGRWAKDKFGITAFVLDDAFQHRRAKRGLDIVCVDATDPFGNGKVLPAGKLRESIHGLKRADVIVITRSDQAENIDKLEVRLRKIKSGAPVFKSSTSITKLVPLDVFHAKTQVPRSDRVSDGFAFAGIANPKLFFNDLNDHGLRLRGECEFPDHFKYSQIDIDEIEAQARSKNAACVITTVKDSVKLKHLEFSLPCYVAEIETVIDDPAGFRVFVLSA